MLTPSAGTQSPGLYRHPTFPLDLKSTAEGALIPAGVPMSFGRNAEIFAEGETSGYVYKVVSVLSCVSKMGFRGTHPCPPICRWFRFQSDDTTMPRRRSGADEADCRQRPGRPPERGIRIASSRAELLRLTMIGLRHSQEHLLLLGRKNALERLVDFLLEHGPPLRLEGRARSRHAAPRHRRLSRPELLRPSRACSPRSRRWVRLALNWQGGCACLTLQNSRP